MLSPPPKRHLCAGLVVHFVSGKTSVVFDVIPVEGVFGESLITVRVVTWAVRFSKH